MPVPGDQFKAAPAAAVNPFEDALPRLSEFTAAEIATLQCRLDKQLGPEFISTRPGSGGGKVHYLAAEKVINLANEVFGFNGWSSQIQNTQIDFVDEIPPGRISLGLSVISRVTLRDGTFHEDVGYGHIENCKGKAAAFEKAKKEAATDALKRALRNFGNVLGNCLYDKDYLSKVTKVKIAPSKWDADNLHRHPDYAPIKRESIADACDETKSDPGVNGRGLRRASTEHEDEFGGNLFDEVEVAEGQSSHPDEVVLHENLGVGRQRQSLDETAQRHSSGQMALPPPQNHPQRPQAPQRHVSTHSATSTTATGADTKLQLPSEGLHQPHPQPPPAHTRPYPHPHPHPHHHPNQTDFATTSVTPPAPQKHQPLSKIPQPQPNHSTPPNPNQLPPPNHHIVPEIGFTTSRHAEHFPAANPPPQTTVTNLPRFNPAQDSPSIRKTPGINHGASRPVSRNAVGQHTPLRQQTPQPQSQPHPPPLGQQNGSVPKQGAQAQAQAPNNNGQQLASRPPPVPAPNFVNPAAEPGRRIGMPVAVAGPGPYFSSAGRGGGYRMPGPAGGGVGGNLQAGVKRPYPGGGGGGGAVGGNGVGAVAQGAGGSGEAQRVPLEEMSNLNKEGLGNAGGGAIVGKGGGGSGDGAKKFKIGV